MKKMKDLILYRVYGESGLETFDEYCHGTSAQHAVDRAREWHESDPNYRVIEVAKVLKGWK